ncbi:MAG: CRTAC1 family protein [Planctomycetota bacterium]|nr:MAG: CRTAC1 family protein [Planctomycetota bacterium]
MVFLENVGRRSRVDAGEFSFWVELGDKSLNGNEANRLFRNEGDGRFRDVAWVAGAARREDARSVVATDVDADGDLDLVVQNFEDEVRLLVNEGPCGHFLSVRLRGTASGRQAIGARVELTAGGRTQTREVRTTAGYLSGVSLACHFGLGAATRVERLVVHWPSGARTVLEDLPADRHLVVTEDGEVLPGPDVSSARPGQG